MELQENNLTVNILGTKRVWEPLGVEVKDKSGTIIEAELVWSFILDNQLHSTETFREDCFIPTIEHLGQK